MMFHHRFKATLAISATMGGLLFAAPALALDADDFATKLAEVATYSGSKITFEEIVQDGDKIVLKSARLSMEAAPDHKGFDMGDVTFDGVEQTDDGSYFVDLVEFEDVNVVEGPKSFTLDDIEIKGLLIPQDLENSPIPGTISLDSFSTGNLEVKNDGKQVFAMSGILAEMNYSDDYLAQDFKLTGSDLAINVDAIHEAKARDTLKAMGYETLTGSFRLQGDWDGKSGDLKLDDYSLTLDNVGELVLTAHINGYTKELVKSMQQAQKMAAANPDKEAAQKAMGLTMLGLMQQLNFVSASLSFEDDSITEKALAYAGKQQGINAEQMGQALKGMVPIMLSPLGLPALQQQIAVAANAFLDKPGNMTVTAEPKDPVSFPILMGAAAGGDPNTIVELLNVEVKANH